MRMEMKTGSETLVKNENPFVNAEKLRSMNKKKTIMIIRTLSTAILILLLSTSMAMAQTTIYVDADATTGANDGSSWDDAYTEIADALKWAREQWDGDTASWDADNPLNIWVAGGTYLPLYDAADGQYTTDGGRDNAFVMVEFVNVYGGFAGAEDPTTFDLADRDFEANETILSGDLNGDDAVTGSGETLTFANNSDNVLRVVIGAFTNDEASAALDGFTISGGNADGSGTLSLINGQQVFSDTGGGMTLKSGRYTIMRTSIIHNSATAGGGIFGFNSSFTLSDVVVDRNSASIGAGVYNSSGSPTLENITITGNRSEITGAGMENQNGSNPFLNNVVISDNYAQSSGGGMHNQESSPDLFNVFFSGNSGFNGGGIHNVLNSSPVLQNVIIIGNTARSDGGGMYSFDGSSPNLVNVMIAGNSAGNGGGGLFNIRNSLPVLTNVTLTGNTAFRGGGIFNANNSSPVLNNVIVWENMAAGDSQTTGASIYNNNVGTVPEISHSLIANSGGSSNWNSDVGQDGGNNIDADPGFTNPPGEDYSLLNTSPAINGGDPAANLSLFPGGPDNPVDLVGNPRVFDGETDVIDIGAYEFQGDPSTIRPDDNNILYVSKTAVSGDGSGSSWENAVTELAGALKWAREQWDGNAAGWDADNPLNIWVAGGTYMPLYAAADGEYTADGGRDNAFVVVQFVNVYGGFVGDEDPATFDLSDRDFETNETILTGDLNGDDQVNTVDGSLTFINRDDNTTHVVIGAFSEEEVNVTLDGVTVMGGNAEGTSELYSVNGQQVFIDVGGGVYIERGNLDLANSILTQNGSSNVGGGFFGSNASLTLENTKIVQNRSSFGGGLSINNGSDALLTGTLITGNDASAAGGGLSVFNAVVRVMNATVYGNLANEGGGIQVFDGGSADIVNTIFQENANTGGQSIQGSDIFNAESTVTVTYSLTQVWETGTGNIVGADPQFSDPENGDFALTHTSPAINSGDPATDLSLFPGGPENPVDAAGKPRVFDGETDVIDMGSYEFQGEPDVSVSVEGDGSGDLGDILPKHMSLSQNYPNPFNPTTTIQFELPQAGPVLLEVYDMIGRRVATLISEQIAAGSHTATFDAGSLSSGVYTYRLMAGGQVFTRQLTLIK